MSLPQFLLYNRSLQVTVETPHGNVLARHTQLPVQSNMNTNAVTLLRLWLVVRRMTTAYTNPLQGLSSSPLSVRPRLEWLSRRCWAFLEWIGGVRLQHASLSPECRCSAITASRASYHDSHPDGPTIPSVTHTLRETQSFPACLL